MNPRFEYRRMAGLLLLASLLPLPFLYIVMPPFWLAAGAAALLLLLAPARSVRLSPLAHNLVAVAIVVVVLAAGGVRVGPLRPLGHLLLLLTAVRAIQIDDRRSFMRAIPLVFLVWVVSLTSSTHITVAAYFAASVALWWWAGMQVNLMAVTGAPARVRPRHAVVAAAAALLLAIPVFVSVPRLRSPWLAGRSGAHSVTGFSSRVDLAGVGPIQASQERALVVRRPDGRAVDPDWMRLRATAFERVTVGSWAPRPPDRRRRSLIGIVPVAEAAGSRGPVELEITLDRPREYLFLPRGTLEVEAPVPVLLDPAGGLVLRDDVEGPLSYRVWVAPEGAPPRLDPPVRGLHFEAPAEVGALAERVAAGASTDAERAAAVESFLRSSFSYSMAGMGRMGPDPISWFLLQSRSGHCEYFAGAMVVLLDALGVPARMVAGYAGGAASAGGAEVVVREANAHAWVEVWLGPELGWRVYDPTPAGGVPGLTPVRARDRLRFAWEWMETGWDRYVLTFGLSEQVDLLTLAGERIAAPLMAHWRAAATTLAVAVLAAGLIILWRSRSTSGAGRTRGRAGTPASRTVDRLVGRLQRAGVQVPPGATVRWIGRAAGEVWPQASGPVSDLEFLAELELYAAGPSPYGAVEVRRVWQQLRRAMKENVDGGV